MVPYLLIIIHGRYMEDMSICARSTSASSGEAAIYNRMITALLEFEIENICWRLMSKENFWSIMTEIDEDAAILVMSDDKSRDLQSLLLVNIAVRFKARLLSRKLHTYSTVECTKTVTMNTTSATHTRASELLKLRNEDRVWKDAQKGTEIPVRCQENLAHNPHFFKLFQSTKKHVLCARFSWLPTGNIYDVLETIIGSSSWCVQNTVIKNVWDKIEYYHTQFRGHIMNRHLQPTVYEFVKLFVTEKFKAKRLNCSEVFRIRDYINKKYSAGEITPNLPYSNSVLLNAPLPQEEVKTYRLSCKALHEEDQYVHSLTSIWNLMQSTHVVNSNSTSGIIKADFFISSEMDEESFFFIKSLLTKSVYVLSATIVVQSRGPTTLETLITKYSAGEITPNLPYSNSVLLNAPLPQEEVKTYRLSCKALHEEDQYVHSLTSIWNLMQSTHVVNSNSTSGIIKADFFISSEMDEESFFFIKSLLTKSVYVLSATIVVQSRGPTTLETLTYHKTVSRDFKSNSIPVNSVSPHAANKPFYEPPYS
ncbi:hypothetical protein GQR58_025482 [Nymphon striatum]|nr:hypothetical protein GQR58_025482 [Nymphon striatum]